MNKDLIAIKDVIRRAQALREGGNTRRMHTVPHIKECLVGLHSWNMVILLWGLHPDPSRDLLMRAATHDVAERWTGDTPAPAKHTINPSLGVELKKTEVQVEKVLELDVFMLNKSERDWLKAVDVLELMMYCADEMGMGNMHVSMAYDNCVYILKGEWVPEIVSEFADNYRWERTENIVNGEVMRDGIKR